MKVDSVKPAKIETFFGQYRFLSNFWPATFVWDGIIWHHSEGAYVAAKTLDQDMRLQISKVKNPGDVKRLGRKLELRPDWEQVKVQIMYEIVKAKFTQNPDLKQKLLDTGDAILEEGNTWGDKVWGISPPGSGNGRNELGKILMRLRDEFRSNA